jgi:hypothetical protein
MSRKPERGPRRLCGPGVPCNLLGGALVALFTFKASLWSMNRRAPRASQPRCAPAWRRLPHCRAAARRALDFGGACPVSGPPPLAEALSPVPPSFRHAQLFTTNPFDPVTTLRRDDPLERRARGTFVEVRTHVCVHVCACVCVCVCVCMSMCFSRLAAACLHGFFCRSRVESRNSRGPNARLSRASRSAPNPSSCV